VELADAGTALDAAHRLSEQLDRKEAMIAALRDEGSQCKLSLISLLGYGHDWRIRGKIIRTAITDTYAHLW